MISKTPRVIGPALAVTLLITVSSPVPAATPSALDIAGISTPAVAAITPLAPGDRLPPSLPDPAYIVRVPSPDGGQDLFEHFQPGQQVGIGVAGPGGTILWRKNLGLRPLIHYFWSRDGKLIALLTDSNQARADLRSRSDRTRNYLFLLDSATGEVRGQANLDTDVLDLPARLPAAVGASYPVSITIENGVLRADIKFRGQALSGSRPLASLLARN